MSKRNGELLRDARDHVFALFRSAPEHVRLDYHGFERTCDVVRACKDIIKGSNLDDAARDLALLCAWFYDACYATGSDDHGKSLELCLRFLDEQQARRPSHDEVTACFSGVYATERQTSDAGDGAPRQGEAPCDVVHDARLVALASKDYTAHSELLKMELERMSGKTFSDIEWTQQCIAFFDSHPYRTRFSRLEYGSRRAANFVRLQRLLRKQQRGLEDDRVGESKSAKGAAKSAESMFYHFSQLQLRLFDLADRRTNTMIHVNAIMMSIVVALLARRIRTEQDLLLPTILLLGVNLVVVYIAIHSMRTPRPTLSGDEATVLDSNLLVFTNVKPVSLPEYAEQMGQFVADPDQYRRKVVEHLYFGRKYLLQRAKELKRTYQVFIYGVALAIVAFLLTLARR